MTMKLLSLEIPDEPALLPEWLEEHLMGIDLRQLVAELGVLGGPAVSPPAALEEVLGDKAPEVSQLGLRSLERGQLRRLMRQPELLLDLQRMVLDEGGEYWTTVPQSPQVRQGRQRTWQNLQASLADEPARTETSRPALRRPWLWAGAGWLAAAAAVLLAVFVQYGRQGQLDIALRKQFASVEELRRELLAQRRLAAADPGDLPEPGILAVFQADPDDTPEGDPRDLPD